MEIEALRVRVSEQDLNSLLREALPPDQPLENLSIQLAPESVIVCGEYPLFVTVPFESYWELTVREGKLAAKLARFKAKGLPLAGAQSMILKFLSGSAEAAGLEVAGDTILVDLDAVLAKHGIHARTNLTAVHVQADGLVLEAGLAPQR